MARVPVKAPAYQWYPKDILTSVRVGSLTDLEELWYRRALDFCWLNVTLPNDPEKFARIVGRGCTVEGAKAVMQMFQVHKKDGTKLVHDRHQKERRKQAHNRKQKSDAGKASAEKRKRNKGLAAKDDEEKGATGVEQALNGNSTFLSPTPVSEEDSNTTKNLKGGPAAKAALTPKAELWMIGKRLLLDAGEKDPGALVGKMVKTYGDAPVIEALTATITKSPADPKTFMFGILRNKKNGNGAYVGKSEDTEPDVDHKCQTCFDKGHALVQNPEAEFGWEQVECPDCSAQEAIAA